MKDNIAIDTALNIAILNSNKSIAVRLCRNIDNVTTYINNYIKQIEDSEYIISSYNKGGASNILLFNGSKIYIYTNENVMKNISYNAIIYEGQYEEHQFYNNLRCNIKIFRDDTITI